MVDAETALNTAETPDIISMTGVSFAWPGERSFRLTIDDFTLKRGTRTLLLGPSGSGKSTLLSLLCGITQPDRGTITLLGTDLTTLSSAARDRFRAEHIGIIFQMFNLLPYGTALDNVLLPLSFAAGRRDRIRKGGSEDEAATQILGALGIDGELLSGGTAQLSVGQQQRVAAARALIGAPEIIVADEPTSALDTEREDAFLGLLFDQIKAAGSTLIMVSHDESLAPRFDQALNLTDLISKEAPAA
ncbi:MAG: ATP-binding cassette domain-containing protein [Pseudomonadota bacterium]